MLNKNDVLSLRDLALSHLPRVQQQAQSAYTEGGGRKAELQSIAFAPVGVAHTRQPAAIELQAAQLLHLVGRHPDTHTEWLNDDVAGDDFPGALTAILKADAERDRAATDQMLVESARELCRLAGTRLPPWMLTDDTFVNWSSATTDSSTSPLPIAVTSIKHKLRSNSLDVPIKKAIQKAASLATGAVLLELRELALSGEPPFTGAIDGGALCYTNDKNEPAKLTKDALAKRLKNHSL
jgi:hypothetical protein